MSKNIIKITGTRKLTRALIAKADPKGIQLVVKANTMDLRQKIKRQTSVAYVKGYSQGNTKQTTQADFPGRYIGQTGITRSYNPFTEYGTRYMAAEPVVGPAAKMQTPIFISDLKKLLAKKG